MDLLTYLIVGTLWTIADWRIISKSLDDYFNNRASANKIVNNIILIATPIVYIFIWPIVCIATIILAIDYVLHYFTRRKK